MRLHPKQVRQPPSQGDRRHGFTLVELLVVVSIISLLLTLLVPSLGRAKRLARIGMCGSNMRQVIQAFASYATQNRGLLPPLGRLVNNKQMRYVHYWTEVAGTDTGWVSFGRLSQRRLLDPHGHVWFCPLQRAQGLIWPGGNRSHENNVPGPKNTFLMDEDKSLGWTFCRAGFHRRTLNETKSTDCMPMADVGNRAFLADSFSTPSQIVTSHGNSVNVAYGGGQVILQPLDPRESLMAGISNSYSSSSYPIIDEIWELFDGR
ncbi:MAG: hypothetical protein BWX88_02303 [Planctomycetes bacterium ADurb.Bin126]|nr:MAG: hypothetical protein BWX88_02303 [Planctomycetes bacterium ADurb.Bin126]HOD81359.1 type II secretion system protein [Phycisphaerae bacterium]HQL73782.1 type II secretion system protein [Phycisphaerae bacterium]